jgi:hypothetical protein
MRNRRDPPRQPTLGEGGLYKSKTKGGRAERESEGLVAPKKMEAKTPSEGRGPALVAPVHGGKCEGMPERANDPAYKVRELQRGLYMTAKRSRTRRLTDRRRRAGMKDIREVIGDLNPVLRGWGNYFRTGNASVRFQKIDQYVHRRLTGLLVKRGGDRRKPFRVRQWPHESFVKDHGLHRLLGTIRHPGAANAS